MKKLKTQIESLEQQQKALHNRMQTLVAKQRDENKKILLRKKILIGETFFNLMEKDTGVENMVKKELSIYLTRPDDKLLFDL